MSNIALIPRPFVDPPRGTCRAAGAVFPYPHRTIAETDRCPRCYGTSVKWKVEARQNMTPDQLRAVALHHLRMANVIDDLVRERALPAPWL